MRPREPLDVGGEPRFGFLPCQTRMHEHERDALQFDGHLRGVVADERRYDAMVWATYAPAQLLMLWGIWRLY